MDEGDPLMFAYISLGLLATTVALGGTTLYYKQKLETSHTVEAVTKYELQACGARLVNLIEDLESDREIDNLPDSALTVVPDHWLQQD